MIFGIDIKAEDGVNIVVLLWGKCQNVMIFHRCGHLSVSMHLVDMSYFCISGPGGAFVVVDPPSSLD